MNRKFYKINILNPINQTDKEVDVMAYDFYGLTEDEIVVLKIVKM